MKMDEELLERMNKANEEATDWTATCHVCGTHLTGTLASIRAHKCEVKDVSSK